MKTLLSHRSIRKYQNRPIEKEILNEILKAVQAAPNWVNLQHISAIVGRSSNDGKNLRSCAVVRNILRRLLFFGCSAQTLPASLLSLPRRYRKCWHSKGFLSQR